MLIRICCSLLTRSLEETTQIKFWQLRYLVPLNVCLQGAKNAREDLLAGITTVRDVGNSGGQFPSLSPDAQNLVAMEYSVISGPQEARQATRQALYDGADCIKVIVDTFLAC
ncbi:hypothetical protein U1Q18_052251 [Sarracenia purpurea var. burkii]